MSVASEIARLGPVVKRGRSVQDVQTPADLLAAVAGRFGEIVFDLAANVANHVPGVNWYGPGGVEEDSLKQNWHTGMALPTRGLRWLNPPYGNIGPWAERCAQFRQLVAPIALLIPASVGSEWFAKHVDRKALVLFLGPRVTFAGHTQPYPKDCVLAVYGERPGYECWRWKP